MTPTSTLIGQAGDVSAAPRSDYLRPADLDEALRLRARARGAVVVAGGTDLMVAANLRGWAPAALLDISRVDELCRVDDTGGLIRLGAGVTFGTILHGYAHRLPGLALAARTVGSAQIRQRATLGGNLATGSPAGDSHPALLALDAQIEMRSLRGARLVPLADFFLGPQRTVLAPDELITAVLVQPHTGPQLFAKVGRRSAMAIALCSLALSIHPNGQRVRVAFGAAAPTARRAWAAERFLVESMRAVGGDTLPAELVAEFVRLVREAADPIDDIRTTADYRRHALGVLAERAVCRAWREVQCD
ncbi:FAD binding domain-containing protein [Micromonospora parathelypteridis]|uniref:CO/xanthine dehydrogenase FAD-binding subunit n=1 Tax=Micromonospora parathelypteridis TaxID=1839617 RepID=A0A840W7R1_9ACTN|nr:xanthine dehydrogenase family protein subunit M [Micromonospora parathelypteridis]MBB5480790.1 CO/xanthine dehydrogenase FAD-binding subunit [Micromonospora parathelypteridis]GGO21613.1 carbon-monoxide dehydrogenase medium subunit [Micromonospora parathelypteridis]